MLVFIRGVYLERGFYCRGVVVLVFIKGVY